MKLIDCPKLVGAPGVGRLHSVEGGWIFLDRGLRLDAYGLYFCDPQECVLLAIVPSNAEEQEWIVPYSRSKVAYFYHTPACNLVMRCLGSKRFVTLDTGGNHMTAPPACFSPNGQFLAVALLETPRRRHEQYDLAPAVAIYDPNTMKMVKKFVGLWPAGLVVTGLSFSTDGLLLCVVCCEEEPVADPKSSITLLDVDY